eukprot:jgi/Ulvmu1/3078/UM015_0118.1
MQISCHARRVEQRTWRGRRRSPSRHSYVVAGSVPLCAAGPARGVARRHVQDQLGLLAGCPHHVHQCHPPIHSGIRYQPFCQPAMGSDGCDDRLFLHRRHSVRCHFEYMVDCPACCSPEATENKVTASFTARYHPCTLESRLNFWTGFYTESGDLVMSKPSIAAAYIKSWFAIDAVSVFPFDWASPSAMSQSSEVSAVALLKSARLVRAAKMLRLLRAVKLLRLLRLPRMFRRLETTLGRSVLHLAAILCGALLLCHASACVFYAVSRQLVVLFPDKCTLPVPEQVLSHDIYVSLQIIVIIHKTHNCGQFMIQLPVISSLNHHTFARARRTVW